MASISSNDAPPTDAAEPKETTGEDVLEEPSEEDAEIERLREETRRLQDGLARARAELANLQKRHERERAAAARYRVEPLARELPEILDVMEEAREVMTQDESVPEIVREGHALTLRHMARVLERFSIEALDPEGKPFDPQLHEAVATRPSEDLAPGGVLEVFRKGYRMHDRLLRPARVVVAAEPKSEKQEPDAEDADAAPPGGPADLA